MKFNISSKAFSSRLLDMGRVIVSKNSVAILECFVFDVKDGKLTMEIFIDRSLVEGYFNSDKAISVRSYADPTAQELRLFGDGEVQVLELRVFTVSSIYQ